MVLLKRKPIPLHEPPPIPNNLDSNVWFIPETDEWFLTYETYSKRIDFYMKPNFVCEITGNTGLTFFDAFESEVREMRKVENTFPESLKEPILRFVQFSTIPRLDVLVDMVYTKFKNDFYPGETCYVKMTDSTKRLGKIKEKARFNAFVNEEGVLTPGYCAYRVFIEKENREFTVDESTLSRERAVFSKSCLKAFMKLAVTRIIISGAPWIVREKFVQKYRIPVVYPDHLKRFDPEFIEYQNSLNESTIFLEDNNKKRFSSIPISELQETSTDKRMKKQMEEKPKKGRGRGRSKKNMDQQSDNDTVKSSKVKPYIIKKFSVSDMLNSASPVETTPKNSVSPSNNHSHHKQPSYTGPIPPISSLKAVENVIKHAQLQNWKSYLEVIAPKKSIIEDLDIPINNDYSNYQIEVPSNVLSEFNAFIKPQLYTVSGLKFCISECLQTWAFLNVYHNALILDSFTFDDFITSLSSKNNRNIDLLNEIFCAVLSCFMLGENEDVNLRIKGYEFSMKDYHESQSMSSNSNSSSNKLKNSKKNNDDDDGDDDDDAYDRDIEDFPIATDGDYENDDYLLIVIPEDYLPEGDSKNGRIKFKKSKDVIKMENDETDTTDKNLQIKNTKSPDNYGLDFDIYEDISFIESNDQSQDSIKEQDSVKLESSESSITNKDDSSEQKDAKKGEQEEEQEEEEIPVEDINNVHKLLNYRNVSWQERLYKRNFKDGYWKIIMLGIFSLIRDLDKFRDIVDEIGSILAPKRSNVSPSSVQNNFYNNLSLELKVKALNILCELLVGGKIIRTYIDNSIEEQTKLKRDRQETVREFKAAMEHARDLNAECSTMVLQWKNNKLENNGDSQNGASLEQQEPEDGKKRRRRRNFTLRNEATPAEIELSLADPVFKAKMDERTAAMNKTEQLRLTRKKIEKKLTEIDSARIRLIGKDKYFNRYWWFEKNGLPMLSKKVANTSSNDNTLKTSTNHADEDEDDEDEDVEEETYLMGRLWVQGPSKDESSVILKFIEKDIENYYSLKYSLEKKVDEKQVLKKRNEKNKLRLDLKPDVDTKIANIEKEIISSKDKAQTKFENLNNTETNQSDTSVITTTLSLSDIHSCISEQKLPLSFIVAVREVFDLEFSEDGKMVKNKDGKIIYSSDMKNITDMPPNIAKLIVECYGPPLLRSSDWRYYDSSQQIEALIRSLNPWGRRESELRKELINLKDAIFSSIKARRKALLLDEIPEEESELMKEINDTYLSESDDEDSEMQEDIKVKDSKFYYYVDDEEDDVNEKSEKEESRFKRGARSSQHDSENKIPKNNTYAENNRLRVSQRELKRKKLEEHLEKKHSYQSKIKKLEKLQHERQLSRCLEWVNSCAIERLGHTHYEGRGKLKTNNGNNKKSRRI